MQSIQRYSFSRNQFYGVWLLHRPSATVRVHDSGFLTFTRYFTFNIHSTVKKEFFKIHSGRRAAATRLAKYRSRILQGL